MSEQRLRDFENTINDGWISHLFVDVGEEFKEFTWEQIRDQVIQSAWGEYHLFKNEER